eukprot:8609658-Pyramimonas_sp.AAC.1
MQRRAYPQGPGDGVQQDVVVAACLKQCATACRTNDYDVTGVKCDRNVHVPRLREHPETSP